MGFKFPLGAEVVYIRTGGAPIITTITRRTRDEKVRFSGTIEIEEWYEVADFIGTPISPDKLVLVDKYQRHDKPFTLKA